MKEIESFKKEYHNIPKDIWDLKRKIATMESTRIQHNETIMKGAIYDVVKTIPNLSISKAGYTMIRKEDIKVDAITVYIVVNGTPSDKQMEHLKNTVRHVIDDKIIKSVFEVSTVIDVEVSRSNNFYWMGAKLI